MPLARFYLYAQGVEVWVAPTLARGDGWVATMRRIARDGRVWVVGVNPCVRVDQIPADFPDRDRVWRVLDPSEPAWVEPGNTVIGHPNGELVAGPLRHKEGILTAEIDISSVHALRRQFDPVGHYHRPDVFRLSVDIRPRPAVVQVTDETPLSTVDSSWQSVVSEVAHCSSRGTAGADLRAEVAQDREDAAVVGLVQG